MNLYQINTKISSMVDPETGEILDYEAFENLAMERDQMLEELAMWYKNLTAEAAMISCEEKKLAERRKELEKRAERLKTYLSDFLAGSKFSTPRVSCTFRKSSSLEIADEAQFIKNMAQSQLFEYLTYKDPTVNRDAVKKAINAGQTFEGAAIVEKNNIQIK